MNPEFQRNLYLEFSTARLIGMPAFLLMVFSLTYLLDDNTLDKVTASTATALYIVLVLFWGAKQAAESIFEELRNNTWDIQKTSAISPWSLAWGKLFGSTIFTWYGGVLCLLVYSVATPKPEFIMLTWVYFLSCGLWVQSLSLLVSLFSFQSKKTFSSGFSYLFAFGSLVFVVPVMDNINKYFRGSMNWYGEYYNQSYFIAISLILACLWAIIGIYRLLAEELRIRTLPWIWLVFTVFVCVFLTGIIDFNVNEQQVDFAKNFIVVSFFVHIVLSYILLFINENSPMLLRKLWLYIEDGQWVRVFQELPCWVISVVLALPVMLLLAMSPIDKMNDIHFYPVVIYLLMIRDIAILLYFSYAPNPKRATGLTLLIIICLNGLLPAIFKGVNADSISSLIFPMLNGNLIIAILAATLQTVVIGFLLFQRWQGRVFGMQQQSILNEERGGV